MLSDSSDDFDQLKGNLPEYQRRIRRQSDEVHFEDIGDFEFWRLNRFNRSNTVHLFDLFSNSYLLLKRRLWPNIAIIPAMHIPLLIFYLLRIPILISIYYVIVYMLSITMIFSMINGEKFLNYLKFIFSLQGLFTIIFKLSSSFLLATCITPTAIRKQSTLVKLVIFNFISFFSLYNGCFIFESKNITALTSLKFSILIVLIPSQFIQVIVVYFFYLVLQLLSVFTLGFSGWISIALAAYSFLGICGSSASISSIYASTAV